MIVADVTLRNYRSYASLDLGLTGGVVLFVGDNGVGKTNLLEALHVGTQGFSPRTRSEGQLVRFGESGGSIALRVLRDGVPHGVRVKLPVASAKVAELDGARLPSAESLRREFATLVFTPDRLAVVKGGPAARRAYFDRVAGRLHPARLAVPQDYAAALAQRNAALRRIQLGLSARDALEPWTERVAALAAELVSLRRDTLSSLTPLFAERAAELGLAGARLDYDAEPPSAEALRARVEQDVARGSTGVGPHLDDVLIAAGTRDLRSFGSQGEQRLAVLALLLAEAELLAREPLLLLDDVLSELDPGRRRVLAERVATMGQVVITATQRSALPVEPAQVVEVSPGQAR
ncbi:MAG: DNA replication and repair protein RecF [Actinobacteria bacterium]|nr:DNA replication and repair protein RecF [Actinomycetota bacterium]